MIKHYELESVPCPLCGCDNGLVIISDAKEMYTGLDEYFDLKKCKKCDMVWTDPRPTQNTISYFYPDTAGYYSPEGVVCNILDNHQPDFASLLNSEFGYSHLSTKNNANINWPPKQFLRRKARLLHIPIWKQGGKLLDIGSSWGRYLKQMSHLGWNVYGVEFNAASVKHAQERLGLLNVRQGQIENLEYPPETFDVIHLSMVLEHLHQPRRVLDKLAAALKPGGQLIVSVPDFSGIEFRVFGKLCYALQVPQHLNYFTPQTITRILREAGFCVESITHQAVDRDFIASLGYARRYQRLLKLLTTPNVRKYFVKPTVLVLALMGLTSRMSIYATKIK